MQKSHAATKGRGVTHSIRRCIFPPKAEFETNNVPGTRKPMNSLMGQAYGTWQKRILVRKGLQRDTQHSTYSMGLNRATYSIGLLTAILQRGTLWDSQQLLYGIKNTHSMGLHIATVRARKNPERGIANSYSIVMQRPTE